MKRQGIVCLVISLMAAVAASPLPAAAQQSHTIRNEWNLKCLQPVNGSTMAGAAIVQEPCDGSTAQQWTSVRVGGGGSSQLHFVNRLSGMCLDARGRAVNGTPVQQWPCNWISNEKWQLNLGTSSTNLISLVSGTRSHCLDVPGDQNIVGLAMQIYRCNTTHAQNWWPGGCALDPSICRADSRQIAR